VVFIPSLSKKQAQEYRKMAEEVDDQEAVELQRTSSQCSFESENGQSDAEENRPLLKTSGLKKQQAPLEIADGAGRIRSESSSSAGVFCCEKRHIRYGALVVLVFQCVSTTLTMRYSRTMSGPRYFTRSGTTYRF